MLFIEEAARKIKLFVALPASSKFATQADSCFFFLNTDEKRTLVEQQEFNRLKAIVGQAKAVWETMPESHPKKEAAKERYDKALEDWDSAFGAALEQNGVCNFNFTVY